MNVLYSQLNKAQLIGDQTLVRLLLDQITYIQTASSLDPDENNAPKNKREALLEQFGR